MKKVVVIGGGTGTFIVLSSLKNYPLHLTAVVSMMDSGGSTGRLRDQYGVLPPGDIRQALVALSEETQIWRNLFTYRFLGGDLDGHNFGNIFLSTLETITGSLSKGIEICQKLLKTKGEVVPSSLDKVELYAQLDNGLIVKGEDSIDTLGKNLKSPVRKIQKIWCIPEARANPKAIKAIKESDYIILGPGDLYTSILPNFIVDGIANAVKRSGAKKIFIVNLMTKRGQTDNFRASDFVKEITKTIGTNIDFIVINNGKIDPKAKALYKKLETVEPVIDDLETSEIAKNSKIIRANLVDQKIFRKNPADKINRSLIRHNPIKLGETLFEIISDQV